MRPASRSTSTSCATWLLIPAYKSAAASPAAVANFSVQLEPAVGVIQLKHCVELAGGNPRLQARPNKLANSAELVFGFTNNAKKQHTTTALHWPACFEAKYRFCVPRMNLYSGKLISSKTLFDLYATGRSSAGTSVHGLRKLAFPIFPCL